MASSSEDDATSKPSEQKPSRLVSIWQKLGLDFKTVAVMIKGSIGPTVAIAMYQSDVVAQHYSTLGFLIAIMALIGFPIMPRGTFLQTMSLNIVGLCLAAAINLLALWSAVQARLHTTPAGVSPSAYNSSASAVCAVWLCFQIYFVSYLRAARPQFQFPVIVYSIFAMVAMSYGPTFPTMATCISFAERLLEAFLTGFAIATAVHFFVFPVTSRQVVCGELAGYLMSVSGVLQAQTAFMHHIETVDPIAARQKAEEEEAKKHKKTKAKPNDNSTPMSPEGKALNDAVDKTMALHTKIHGDITMAHREFAVGKIDAKEISTFWKKSRSLMTPLMGLVSILEQLRRFGEEKKFSSSELPEEEMTRNAELIDDMRTTARAIREPLSAITQTFAEGLQHVCITMEFVKPPKQKKKKKTDADPERGADSETPGSDSFAKSFKQRLDDFEGSKKVTLENWCQQKGIANPEAFLSTVSIHIIKPEEEDQLHDHLQRQMFLMLYLEYLIVRIGQDILELIIFADQLRQDGRFKHRRLLFPGRKTLFKWLKAVFGKEDMTREEHFMSDMEVGATESVALGKSFGRKKDPEHLPPQTVWERIGEVIRLCPKFFRSENSSFAFRVVCATMSLAIVAYLEASQQFFQQQRLIWSLIMLTISMSRTAGQSTFNFVLRVLGTLVAMIGAYIIWYIVDGRAPGVIVFLWLWIFCGFYVVAKYPKFIIVAILGVVTSILIIGYELQVQTIGQAAAESNGQPAYPTYLLAPYRLLTVAGGLLVAWLWTIWPFPVSEHSELRKDLAASLYLLANFYSNVHETVISRVRGTAGDVNQKGSHAYMLDKAKVQVMTKILAVLSQVQMNAGFEKFQVVVGGRFPRETYEEIIACVRRLMVSTSLIAHASDTLSDSSTRKQEHSEWYEDFRNISLSIGNTSHSITSTLSLLSSSLSSGQPLPPYMVTPKPFEFVTRLEAIDKNLLSIQHITEPEYSAFVVIQLCAESMNRNLATLKKLITELVGEMDFSFNPPTASTTTSLTLTDSRSDELKQE